MDTYQFSLKPEVMELRLLRPLSTGLRRLVSGEIYTTTNFEDVKRLQASPQIVLVNPSITTVPAVVVEEDKAETVDAPATTSRRRSSGDKD